MCVGTVAACEKMQNIRLFKPADKMANNWL